MLYYKLWIFKTFVSHSFFLVTNYPRHYLPLSELAKIVLDCGFGTIACMCMFDVCVLSMFPILDLAMQTRDFQRHYYLYKILLPGFPSHVLQYVSKSFIRFAKVWLIFKDENHRLLLTKNNFRDYLFALTEKNGGIERRP